VLAHPTGTPISFSNPVLHISAAMTTNLTDRDRADLARFLREAIEADRFPLSPRVRRLKRCWRRSIPAPAPAVTPYPAPKPPGEPSHLMTKKRRR